MAAVRPLGLTEVITFLLSGFLLYRVVANWRSRSKIAGTELRGPPNPSFWFGLYRSINESDDAGLLFEQWAKEYGPHSASPAASIHFYSKETFGYVQTKLARVFIENLFGRGLLWAEGESHRRQRKALSPAFSNAAIRRLTHVFYDSTYKLKSAWDTILDANPRGATIDVQQWMNHVSLDSVGIAGFGHDFGSLDGKRSSVADVFASFGTAKTSPFSHLVFLLSPVLPMLVKLPTSRNQILKRLRVTMGEIADELLERTRKEKEGQAAGSAEEKSIIGLLIKAESSTTQLQMSHEEIMAQYLIDGIDSLITPKYSMYYFSQLLASRQYSGYETTSMGTYRVIKTAGQAAEAADELSQFAGADPTWDQLSSSCRTSTPSCTRFSGCTHRRRDHRIAAEDDVIPFSAPITTASGEQVTSLVVPKGTTVTSPIRCMNRSEAFWGPTAKQFAPERWLGPDEAGIAGAREIGGHRHLLTFSDGPRICLGRSFALTEFKLPDGPDTVIEKHRSILPRPKVAGQDGAKSPLWCAEWIKQAYELVGSAPRCLDRIVKYGARSIHTMELFFPFLVSRGYISRTGKQASL
ncbi:cytochrome P450 [Infundibulicybe gibba]|nr:cytochrome P450 [Infundibulicybe gibba]